MTVGIVIVSHSMRLAEGVVEFADQMAQGRVAIAAAGGTQEGELGTSVEKILVALRAVQSPTGILVLLDMGSAVMAAEMAIEEFALEQSLPVLISSAPLVEGAIVAAVEASVGNSLDEVAQAASEARSMPKVRDPT